MPPGVLNALKPIIDYRDVVDGVDYTSSVFIFLSNTGSKIINKQYLDYWKLGRSRKSLKISDFEKLIQQGAFNEEGSSSVVFSVIKKVYNYFVGKKCCTLIILNRFLLYQFVNSIFLQVVFNIPIQFKAI